MNDVSILEGSHPYTPARCTLGKLRMSMHILRHAAPLVVWPLAILTVCVTILPLWNTNEWWVRAMGFPRVQILVASLFLMIGALFLNRPAR